ncbi:MAG: hypothetical protein M3Q33_10795 [Acidobacteriota bacterium]|nr:hypothetical protein [Acidobacteriota bacterium]
MRKKVGSRKRSLLHIAADCQLLYAALQTSGLRFNQTSLAAFSNGRIHAGV